ncbi:MAG: DUF4276 family protein [Magnetococcales bacterium]|nr:DUF4276 family protein [Magnetococcales bacterium]
MIRLHMTAEGQTEQAFVKRVLMPHLACFNVFVDARCVLTSKDHRASKEYRGGMTTYTKARNDIQNWMKEDSAQECRFTTMFDLCRLPNDFPGYGQSDGMEPYKRVSALEADLAKDINCSRFIPYIQLHEFEALILANPKCLDWEYMEHNGPINKLIKDVGSKNPELINGGLTTAPSQRILAQIPEYDKVGAGPVVAEKIGLPTLRQKCQHFNDWLIGLERLAGFPNG